MTRFLAPAATALLTFALVWALVLGWWQANEQQPSDAELLLALGALPLCLVGGYWLLRAFIEHLQAPPPAADAATAAAAAPSATASDASARRLGLALIGAAVTSGPGRGAAEILAAVAESRRPEPDAALRDHAGFPVYAARFAELDPEAFRDTLDEAGLPPAARVRRGLALLAAALPPLVAQAAEALHAGDPATQLRVHWLVPTEWGIAAPEHLHAWLQAHALADLAPARLEITLTPLAHAADALQALDRIILQANTPRSGGPTLYLLLAADSLLDDAVLAALDAAGALHSAQRPEGRIPGEGAVALLFARDAERLAPGATDPDVGPVSVSRANIAERDHPLGAAGRVSGALLEQLAADLIALHDIPAAQVRAVLADTDHRPRHTTELMQVLAERFPELDPLDDCPAVGTVCGSLGALDALVALVCARDKAWALEGPVLCLSNQASRTRAAVLLQPLAPAPQVAATAT